MSLPSVADLNGPILDAFHADSIHTSAWDMTGWDPFQSSVKDESQKAFAKAMQDGFTQNREDFFAWCSSPLLRWAVKPGAVSPDGEPFKALMAWLDAWHRALPWMNGLAGSNLIGGKPVPGFSPYYRHFELTYPIHEAIWKRPIAARADAIRVMRFGPEIVAWMGLK